MIRKHNVSTLRDNIGAAALLAAARTPLGCSYYVAPVSGEITSVLSGGGSQGSEVALISARPCSAPETQEAPSDYHSDLDRPLAARQYAAKALLRTEPRRT